MKRIVVAVIAVIVVIALVGFGAWYLQSSQKPYAGKPELITIGEPMLLESSGLIYIADDQHFFADNGLNVTIKKYDTGFNAVNGMLNDENDIAVATEFVLVENAFQQEKICSIGSIAKYQTYYIIGQKDKGIENASDLSGKKIGNARGTVGEFYLGRFLELHNIDRGNVTIVDIKPSQFNDAIGNGTVDAIIVYGPYVETIKDRLGANAVMWRAQSGQLGYWNAICRGDWAAQHPELIDRFLKSIDQAVDYTVYHPAEAKAIIQKRLHADDAYVASAWNDTQFGLSFDQSLVSAMDDEGRWLINNNLTSVKKVPDYRGYIYINGMDKVKPGSIDIVP
jgi:NitT/TauT family transport system substrate-binding protein